MRDIVYVDNDPEELLFQATPEQKQRISEFVFTDEDDDADPFAQAGAASLWVFDYFLIGEPRGENRSENGVSYFYKWRNAVTAGRPVTAVVSGHLESAIGDAPLGPKARYHVHAARMGVEWLGGKDQEAIACLVELADASSFLAALLEAQPTDGKDYIAVDLRYLCRVLLRAPEQAVWTRSVERQVDRARPPRIAPPHAGHGAARLILGWLLHNVLPYSSFLMTDLEAAVRLGITPESFARLASEASPMQEELSAASYAGPLAKFDGRRWWRAGMDHLAWRLSQEPAGYRTALETEASPTHINWLTQSEPVIVSDHDLVQTSRIAEISVCVRAFDEDFPAGAEPAYVLIEDANKDARLAAKVVFEDRTLLESNDE